MKRLYRIVMTLIVACASTASAVIAVADDAIETIAVEQSRAVSVDGGIQLTASIRTGFEIYSITGQRVKTVTVENSTVMIDLPKGCYIVRCPQWSKKAIVK